MNNSFHIIKKLHIHPILWAVAALAIVTAHFLELCILFTIIFIHEMGHAVTASFFSWRIKKIALLPFGGVAEMDEHGNRPLKEEAWVILAGPLQHVWMLILGYIGYSLNIVPEDIYFPFIQFNFMVLIFNLLPIWPLDGGKLLFLLFSLKQPFPQAHINTLFLSIGSILCFIFINLIIQPLNMNVWIIVAFLLFSLYYEWKQRRYIFMRFLLERYYGKNPYFRTLIPLSVKEDDMVIDILERFQRGCKHPIIIEGNGSEIGTLDENELLHIYFSDKQLTAKVRDLLYYY